MINSTELSLCLRGSREYIQGTNMLDAAMVAIACGTEARIENLSFSIGRMTSKNLLCNWWEAGSIVADQCDSVSTFLFTSTGVPYEGRLVELEEDVKKRMPFDESVITKCCVFAPGEKRVTLAGMPLGVSPIEVLVSMNKALHHEIYKIASNSQWVFCRWESSVWPLPNELGGVILTIEQSLGIRLTRARIECNNKLVGRMYFSAKNSEA